MNQLYTKYHVRTPDEQPLDSGCFVLRPFNSDGTIRDPAAVAALKTYANFLPSAQRELRAEITDWVDTPGLSLATRALNVPPSLPKPTTTINVVEVAGIAKQLRQLSIGKDVWRIQDRDTKAIVVTFLEDQKPIAEVWLEAQQEGGQYMNCEVARAVVYQHPTRLMIAAADMLDALIKTV